MIIITVYHKNFISTTFLFVLIFICNGCCNLPGVNCGPTIDMLKTYPHHFNFDTHGKNRIDFYSRVYYSRNMKGANLILESKVNLDSNSLIYIDSKNVYFFDGSAKVLFDDIPEFGEDNLDHKVENTYYFQSKFNKIEFPLILYMDKVMHVTNSDTIYHDIKLTITKSR